MKDKTLYIVLGVLILGNIVLGFRNIRVTEVKEVRNVLPENKNKELKEPDEVRQYVLEMARRKGVSVSMVDKIARCESNYRYNAVSKSGTYIGIFQIGKIHGLGNDRYDVIKSTEWSLNKMKKEGYEAWSCSKI